MRSVWLPRPLLLLLLGAGADAILVPLHTALRHQPRLPRAVEPRSSAQQVTLTTEQLAILLQRVQQLEARVEQLEREGSTLSCAGKRPLRLSGRIRSHLATTAARLSGIAPLPGLYGRLVLGAAVGPANTSASIGATESAAAQLRSTITFRSEFLRLLGNLGKDGASSPSQIERLRLTSASVATDPLVATAASISMADPTSDVVGPDDPFFSQLSRTAATTAATGAATAAAIDMAARSAKASVEGAFDRVVSDAGRLASSVITLPPTTQGPLPAPLRAAPTERVTRARLASIIQKREHLLRQRERLLQQPREVVERALSAVNSTLGALNNTLAIAEKQLASRRLLGASFALGATGGLLLHYALSGFGGGISAAPKAALRAILGGFLAAYSSTLANRVGSLARLVAAVGLTLWDQLQEKRRQAEFVYHTGRLFERMDAQLQAWHLDRWVSASASAVEGMSTSVAEWYVGTTSSIGAAFSGGWNATIASTAGALAPIGASVSAALIKVDNATGFSSGVNIGAQSVAQGLEAVVKGIASVGDSLSSLQPDFREWLHIGGGPGGNNSSNTTSLAQRQRAVEGASEAQSPRRHDSATAVSLRSRAQARPSAQQSSCETGQQEPLGPTTDANLVSPPPPLTTANSRTQTLGADITSETFLRARMPFISLFPFGQSGPQRTTS